LAVTLTWKLRGAGGDRQAAHPWRAARHIDRGINDCRVLCRLHIGIPIHMLIASRLDRGRAHYQAQQRNRVTAGSFPVGPTGCCTRNRMEISWSTTRPITRAFHSGHHASFQLDGNFVVYNLFHVQAPGRACRAPTTNRFRSISVRCPAGSRTPRPAAGQSAVQRRGIMRANSGKHLAARARMTNSRSPFPASFPPLHGERPRVAWLEARHRRHSRPEQVTRLRARRTPGLALATGEA
jgi:hypothetical protein